MVNGSTNPVSCEEQSCVDGLVLRGSFSDFSVPGDTCSNANVPWNALESEIEKMIEECANKTRQASGTGKAE